MKYVFALLALSIIVVSFPLLLDRMPPRDTDFGAQVVGCNELSGDHLGLSGLLLGPCVQEQLGAVA